MNFKALSAVLFAVVVSLVISNVYLYKRSYYGQPTLKVLSRTLTVWSNSSNKQRAVESMLNRVKAISSTHQRGYLLTLKVYEQQTMATGNLMQLQCFASKLDLSVVQPLMKDSELTTPLDQSQHQHMLQLEDVYDMEDWKRFAQRNDFAPLVKWEDFIKYAPREVVVVQIKYPSMNQVKIIRESGRVFPHQLSRGEDYKEGCDFRVIDNATNHLRSENFVVVRRLCYNFMSGNEIPLHVYQHELLGGHHPSNVTLIIDEWRGLKESQRLLIKEDICIDSALYRDQIGSSSKIARYAKLYARRYLRQRGGDSTNYLAVIARYEMTALASRRAEIEDDPNASISYCIKQTLGHISRLKKTAKLKQVFLSVDIGKYGSKSFEKKNYYGHQQDIEKFVRQVYRRMNVTGWERSFEKVVGKSDTGYIAKVQQAIVARAKCVLFVGGGSFQQHTLHLYQELHPSEKERCIKVAKRCTSKYRPVQ